MSRVSTWKSYITWKAAGIAAAAALLVGAGAAGAVILTGGSSSASQPAASAGPDGPGYDSAFGSAGASSSQPQAGSGAVARPQLDRNLIEGVAAKAIGISGKDVRTQLQQGKSLAQVASDHNISRDVLKTALANGEKAYLANSVKNGTLTQQYADQTMTAFTARLDQLIDQSANARRPAQ